MATLKDAKQNLLWNSVLTIKTCSNVRVSLLCVCVPHAPHLCPMSMPVSVWKQWIKNAQHGAMPTGTTFIIWSWTQGQFVMVGGSQGTAMGQEIRAVCSSSYRRITYHQGNIGEWRYRNVFLLLSDYESDINQISFYMWISSPSPSTTKEMVKCEWRLLEYKSWTVGNRPRQKNLT